ELSAAYRAAWTDTTHPSVLALTRQNLPQLEGSEMDRALRGAYVLLEAADAKVTLVASGSEVSLSLDAARDLAAQGVPARVVSMPCWEAFAAQPIDYRREVFRDGVPVLACEASGMLGWERWSHAQVGLAGFGASAPAAHLFDKF